MDVRKLEPADIQQVVDVFIEAYDREWTTEQARPYLEKFYGFEPESCLVGVYQGELVGAVLGYSYPRKDEVVLFVQELFVHPKHRHHGVGRKLVEALRARFDNPQVNIKPLVKAREGVLAFYNSLGFDQDQAFTFYDE